VSPRGRRTTARAVLLAIAVVLVGCAFYFNPWAGLAAAALLVPGFLLVRSISKQLESNARREIDRYAGLLRYAEARTRTILDTAGDGILTVDESGVIRSINRAGERLFGYPAQEIVGANITQLIDEHDDRIADKVGTGEAKVFGVGHEVIGRRKDGSEFPLEPAVSKIGAGSKRRYSYIVRDLTERKRAEAMLRQARDDLELRVAERTEQLTDANEALRQGEDRLRHLSRQLLQTQENERRHLAHELHDEIGQTLTAIKMTLQAARRGCDAEAHLDDGIGLVERTLVQVRNLSLDLRPAMLDQLGLVPAVRWYLDRQAQRADLVAYLDADADSVRLKADLETTCFRLVQESLTNVVRHAEAKTVWVTMKQRPGQFQLSIRDDGKGFNVADARRKATHGGSLGLLGLQERVQLVGGSLSIHSEEGQGTDVRARIPVDETAANGSMRTESTT
jgi:two-component system sensor histidine kinase UhpB